MMKTSLVDSLLAALVLALLIALAGCGAAPQAAPTPTAETSAPEGQPTNTTDESISTPRLRIKNGGAVDIQGLTVIFPDSRIVFGNIPAGATSEYQPAPQGVYNYAAYEFTVNGETVSQPVIDWVGESPRPGQSYTYVLSFDPSRPAMQMIELVEVQADLN